MVEILFVHGALVRDGAWWWQRVASRIRERTGTVSRAVELPSCGEGAMSGAASLLSDALALRAALDDVDSAVVVGYRGRCRPPCRSPPGVHHLVPAGRGAVAGRHHERRAEPGLCCALARRHSPDRRLHRL